VPKPKARRRHLEVEGEGKPPRDLAQKVLGVQTHTHILTAVRGKTGVPALRG